MKKNTKIIIISIVVVLCLVVFAFIGYFIYIRSTYISKEEVKDIVIKDTKLKKEDISFKEIDLDLEEETKKYDVEFYYNRVEYKYEVDAKSGDIIYSDFNNSSNSTNTSINTNNNNSTNTNTNNYISEEEAREIALRDASLNANEVTFTDIDLDLKNGNAIYEVDFESNTQEYEYKIDGITKAIINKKQEPRD